MNPPTLRTFNYDRDTLSSLTGSSALLRPCVAVQEQLVGINVFERLGQLLQIGEGIPVGEWRRGKPGFHSRTAS